jgi:HEAT repeat protein
MIVRLKAIRGLGLLKTKQATGAIGAALAQGIRNLRKETAAALGEIADPTSLPLLREYTSDPDPDGRNNVLWAIERIDRR